MCEFWINITMGLVVPQSRLKLFLYVTGDAIENGFAFIENSIYEDDRLFGYTAKRYFL